MSTNGVGALERGDRHSPQRETLALLVGALALDDEQCREFEAAASRSGVPRHLGGSSATAGPSTPAMSNLPLALTSFVGRERDVADVKELLSRHSLITLVGSGGVGKTRLAVQVGAEQLDRYPDGVLFVDFAPITDPELVTSIVAQVLGIHQQGDRPVEESILRWLKRKRLLLLFDNCEHLVESVASIVASILNAAPYVRILATSRQVLGIGGETVHRLPPLSVPNLAAGLKMDEALQHGAVSLFVDRAEAADTRFVLTEDNTPIIAEICRRLDGIPLAIELAAARVTVLSIPNLAQRLNERFKILTGRSRAALPRQKTLGALIDWSYNLLTPQEQLLFARLGVFASGFSLDAATRVCGTAGLDEIDILDLLGSLTDKSLVAADTSGEHERYRLLESTAAYALQKLNASGEREAIARRHAEYFCHQAEAAGEAYDTGSVPAGFTRMELELDNYRTVLGWALAQGNDATLGAAITSTLHRLWVNGGLAVEGRYWIRLALERVSEAEHPQIAARLRLVLSWLSSGTLKHDEAERAMRLYESVDDRLGAARAQAIVAFALYQMGRLDDARTAVEQAFAVLRDSGDDSSLARCLNIRASIEWNSGDLCEARELFAQALAAWKALGNEGGAAVVLGNVAELEFSDGHHEQALHAVNEALQLSRAKQTPVVANWSVNRAAYSIALGDVTGARESARTGLRLAQQAEFEAQIAAAIQHLALLAGLGGDGRRAAQLLGYVDAQYRLFGTRRQPTERWGYDKLVATLHETLSEDEIASLAAEGAVWLEDQAVEEALKA